MCYVRYLGSEDEDHSFEKNSLVANDTSGLRNGRINIRRNVEQTEAAMKKQGPSCLLPHDR